MVAYHLLFYVVEANGLSARLWLVRTLVRRDKGAGFTFGEGTLSICVLIVFLIPFFLQLFQALVACYG